MGPTASVIVLAHGNRRVTERCLDSLADALGDELGRSFELVLVDNASPDDTAELFAEWSDRAEVVLLPENRNFAGGCNAGAEASRGRVLVFLNNDTEVPAGALEAIVEQALEPGVGIVGARLLYPDGTIQHAGVVHRQCQPGLVMPLHAFHHERGDLPQACAIYDLDAVTGACLTISAALFRELDGFDIRYVNGLEDIDLCLRARLAGHRVVYRGDAHLIHHERVTRGGSHDESENSVIFQKRWSGALADDGELLGRLFDMWFGPPIVARYFGAHAEGVPLAVAGRLRSASPEAAEARALLTAFEAADIGAAARDWQPAWEAPRSAGPEWETLVRAEKLQERPGAGTIRVVGGALWSLGGGEAAIARVATLPRPGGRLDVDVVWAASPMLIDEIVDAGLPADRVGWLPPAIPDVPLGPGGGGILVLLPVHDCTAGRRLLEAIRTFPDMPVRVLPNVGGEFTERLVADILPGAELVTPITDERRFADLVAASDVVCGTDGDAFERRPLIAAATGAAVVTLGGGSAAAVLGRDHAVPGWTEMEPVRSAVERALEDAGARATRADVVRRECGLAPLGDRLRDLVDAFHTARLPRSVLATRAVLQV